MGDDGETEERERSKMRDFRRILSLNPIGLQTIHLLDTAATALAHFTDCEDHGLTVGTRSSCQGKREGNSSQTQQLDRA